MNRIAGCPVHAKHVQAFEHAGAEDASNMAPRKRVK